MMLTIRGTASSVRFDPKFLKTAVAVQVSGLAHSNIWECPPKNHENPPPSIKTISFGRGKTSQVKNHGSCRCFSSTDRPIRWRVSSAGTGTATGLCCIELFNPAWSAQEIELLRVFMGSWVLETARFSYPKTQLAGYFHVPSSGVGH